GWLKQQAHHTVRAAAFESITSRQRTAAQRVARERAASLGIGMMHELGGPDISGRDDFAELMTLARDESGPEVVGYWGEGGGATQALSLGAHGAAGDLFVDGAIGSRTALLRQPYTDNSTTGAQYLSAAEIRDHVAACSVEGVQAGFHVIGDGATDLVAAGFTEAVAKVGIEVVRGARHRLEHVEMVDATHLRLFAELGLVLSVQPVFDELWGGDKGMYVSRLGRERANTLNPFAQMLDAGIVLAFGSDAPVTPLGPWAAVRAATQHQTREHRISVDAAFDAHTRGGWLAAGFDAGGVLTIGAPANIAIWSVADSVITTAGATTAGDRDRAASSRPHASTLPALEPDAPLPICLRTVVRGATVFLRD
ncbi:MAG: amidohydrolase family protein, partial [Candidatus Nanopelagicales bacterium]